MTTTLDRMDIHAKFTRDLIHHRMLELMNQTSLIKERDPREFLNDSNFISWRQYLETKVRTMCTACVKETGDYWMWEDNDWRFDAIRDMDVPRKRLAKFKIKRAKYDHKGKEPNDHVKISTTWITLLFLALAISTASGF